MYIILPPNRLAVSVAVPCCNCVNVADMHMMVSRPEQWVKPMSAAGANQYTFHLEATTNPGNLIKEIRESGMKVRTRGFTQRGRATFSIEIKCSTLRVFSSVVLMRPQSSLYSHYSCVATPAPPVGHCEARKPTEDALVEPICFTPYCGKTTTTLLICASNISVLVCFSKVYRNLGGT